MLKIGGTEITDVKLGSTQVNKVYQGSNLIWEKNSPILPTGYTQVEYIKKDTGTFYLNTGIKATQNTYIRIVFQIANYHNYPFILSAHTSNRVNDVAITLTNTGTKSGPNYRFGRSQNWSGNTLYDKHTSELKDKKWYEDGTVKFDGSSQADFVSSANIILFSGWGNSSSTAVDTNSFDCRGTIWELQIDDHVYIPCRSSIHNSYGLYDLKTNTFLYNTALKGGNAV